VRQARVRGAHLGLEGVGKAALYRLTDCPYAGQPATYDFHYWNGVLFDQEKQNPGLKIQPPRPKKPAIRSKAEMTENGNKWSTEPAMTSFTRSRRKLPWTTSTLTEIEYTEELRRLYQCEVIDFMASIAISNGASSPSLAVH
jgi:hypothetical protein